MIVVLVLLTVPGQKIILLPITVSRESIFGSNFRLNTKLQAIYVQHFMIAENF